LIDYLIVGQGLAGTLLGNQLIKNGCRVIFIDAGHEHASTHIAAGIINPLTGRKFVKSWRIDDLIPFADTVYQEFETSLNKSFIKKRSIVRPFADTQMEQEWLIRTAQPEYQPYIVAEEVDLTHLHNISGYGITRGWQINISGLIYHYRNYLLERNMILHQKFAFDDLVIEPAYFTYDQMKFKHIIFCEGIGGKYNPYFQNIPFVPAKGEVLICRIPGYPRSYMLKHGLFIVPIESDLFWIGTTYEWDTENVAPSQKGKEELMQKLQKILRLDFEIVDHRAAIRPTVKDRRPILGKHDEIDNMYMFNGLGTKGTSLGPYFSNMMTDYLLRGGEILKEVRLKRFAGL
jgi:glycine/D-amino acid oxidase-like deaminating enzyme